MDEGSQALKAHAEAVYDVVLWVEEFGGSMGQETRFSLLALLNVVGTTAVDIVAENLGVK
jgi:hypothetical protein